MNGLVALVEQHGPLSVFALTLASRVGAPVPAAPLLVIAGALAYAGRVSALDTAVGSMLANILGDGIWFLAGSRFGYRVMRVLCRVALCPDSCVRQCESFISRWGGGSLILAKFIPGLSIIAAPMAGAMKMPLTRFLVYASLGALVWTAAFMILGVVLRDDIQRTLDALLYAGTTAAGAAIVLLAAAVVATRYLRRCRVLRELRMPRVDPQALNETLNHPNAPLVVDVRSPTSRELEPRQVPGAVAVPLEDLEGWALALPKDREIVLYCNCPNEVTSARAARFLVLWGVSRAHPLRGGLDGWLASNLRAEGIDRPQCEQRDPLLSLIR